MPVRRLYRRSDSKLDHLQSPFELRPPMQGGRVEKTRTAAQVRGRRKAKTFRETSKHITGSRKASKLRPAHRVPVNRFCPSSEFQRVVFRSVMTTADGSVAQVLRETIARGWRIKQQVQRVTTVRSEAVRVLAPVDHGQLGTLACRRPWLQALRIGSRNRLAYGDRRTGCPIRVATSEHTAKLLYFRP